MSYERARRLLISGGLAVLLLTAVVMYVRRVDPVEVAATLLFIPVFVCFVFWGSRGGLLAGIAAAAAYALLRAPAIDAVGIDRFTGLLFSRGLAFLAFGAIGGFATRQLEASLDKLELYDQIDDATGLFNARFFVQDTELEMSRADRYQTIFSICLVDIPADSLYPLKGRQKGRLLKEVGRLLSDSVRTVDRAVHARDGNKHRLAVVLPETATEGATVFTERLAEKVSEYLIGRGAKIDAPLNRQTFTFPEDQAGIVALRQEFALIDRSEHPEAPETREPGETS